MYFEITNFFSCHFFCSPHSSQGPPSSGPNGCLVNSSAPACPPTTFSPSLALHFNENLIRHVQSWPSDHVEKQVIMIIICSGLEMSCTILDIDQNQFHFEFLFFFPLISFFVPSSSGIQFNLKMKHFCEAAYKIII